MGRRLRAAAGAVPVGRSVAETRPRGKQTIEAPTGKRSAGEQPEGERQGAKRTRHAAPTPAPRRTIPTSAGAPLRLSVAGAPPAPEADSAEREGVEAATPEARERTAWRDQELALREEMEASAKAWEGAATAQKCAISSKGAGGAVWEPWGAEGSREPTTCTPSSSAAAPGTGQGEEVSRLGGSAQTDGDWAGAGEASSGAHPKSRTPSLDRVRRGFASLGSYLQTAAPTARDQLNELEHAVAALHDVCAASHNRLRFAYKAALADLPAKEGELQQIWAAGEDPAEIQTLRRLLARPASGATCCGSRWGGKTHRAELDRLAEEQQKALAEKDEAASRAAQEIASLKADRDSRTVAWTAREQEMLAKAHRVDELLAEAFPETQEAAEDAANTRRDDQREARVCAGRSAAWTVEETGVAACRRLRVP